MTDVRMFLQATVDETQAFRVKCAPPCKQEAAKKKRYSGQACLSVGDVQRLQGWVKAIDTKVDQSSSEDEQLAWRHCFVNLAQTAQFMQLPPRPWVPALLRHSKLFCIGADRWVHPLELLSIMGVPVSSPSNSPLQWFCTLSCLFLLTMMRLSRAHLSAWQATACTWQPWGVFFDDYPCKRHPRAQPVMLAACKL